MGGIVDTIVLFGHVSFCTNKLEVLTYEYCNQFAEGGHEGGSKQALPPPPTLPRVLDACTVWVAAAPLPQPVCPVGGAEGWHWA